MLFTVTCPGCGTDFPVDPRKVPEDGVYAQCSVCPQIFWVDREMLIPAPVATVTAQPRSGGGARAEPRAPAAAEATPATATVAPPVATHPGPAHPEPVLAEPAEGSADVAAHPREPAPTSPAESSAPAVREAAPAEAPAAPAPEPVRAPSAVAAAPNAPSAPAQGASPSAAPTFGRRDPHERAARLARVLVSDMVAYHPDRHRASLQAGTLADDFEDEILKSWSEYVQQVGKDMAESTDYWRDALNQVLARGTPVF